MQTSYVYMLITFAVFSEIVASFLLIPVKQNVDLYLVIVLTMFRRRVSVSDDLLMGNVLRGRNLIVL